MDRSYYDVLGVAQSASRIEIRNAYRRLIQLHHPDRNASSPDASHRAAILNEAYSVLYDPAKRALHDAWLRTQAQPTPSAGSSNESGRSETFAAAPPPPDIRCHRCGRRDSTLRLAVMYYVVSMLVMTRRGGKSGVWCSRCRALESFKWTGLSCLAGWWGFPWGPIYTIGAIFTNGAGGTQPQTENAALLRFVSYLLYTDGNHSEARLAVDASLNFEAHEQAVQFREHLVDSQTQPAHVYDYWKFASAAPALVFVALAAVFIYSDASAPTGYEARYQAPAERSASGQAVSTIAAAAVSPMRSRVNARVDRLAGIVSARAPVVGTHMEGTSTVRDHVLDRSKFDADELYGISNEIHAELSTQSADPDGFVTSSYFNAALFALSVDIAGRIEEGQSIREQVSSTRALGDSPAVNQWLEQSRFAAPFADLLARLADYGRQYRPGRSVRELQADYDDAERILIELRKQMTEHENRAEVQAYNALVPTHNATVERLNQSARFMEIRATVSQKLDLAFNRCLDGAILLGRFDKVDLTSHAAEIESLPEPTPGQ
jgi:DnaJ-like protein